MLLRRKSQADDTVGAVLDDPCVAQRTHGGGLAGTGRSDQQVDPPARGHDRSQGCDLLVSQTVSVNCAARDR